MQEKTTPSFAQAVLIAVAASLNYRTILEEESRQWLSWALIGTICRVEK